MERENPRVKKVRKIMKLEDQFKSKGINANKNLAVASATPLLMSIKWFEDEYLKQWQHKPMSHVEKCEVNHRYSSLMRQYNISRFCLYYVYNTMDMIVVVMKIHSYTQKKEANFGTLFCELSYDMPEILLQQYAQQTYGNVLFTFCSLSPSYISCDGEFRSHFASYYRVIHTKATFPELWQDIDIYLNRIKVRRQWSIYTGYFYPKLEQEHKNTEVEHAVKSEDVSTSILLAVWFNTIYEEMLSITKTHINTAFKEIFLAEKVADIAFIQTLVEKYGIETIDKFNENFFKSGSNNFHLRRDAFLPCGYKMIPLNIKEVQDPLKLRYKPWREYFITKRATDFVLNSIAPGFAIILDWFYIKNSRKGLFDNTSQYERMKHSEIAKDILHVLYEAQRNTYFASENLEGMKKTSSGIKKWISSSFRKLSEKIDDPINYSIEAIIMSEVTLSFAVEYVGRTVSDNLSLITTSELYNTLVGKPLQESGYNYFAKYMFDICYSLLCLNQHMGVIHGDLHLNNATIGPLYTTSHENIINENQKFRVVYVLDDDFQYMFPNNSYFGSIIDFSRSIVDFNRVDGLRDSSIPSTYKLVSDETKFRYAEMNTLLNLYIQMFPNKIRQKEELVVLFKNHFEAVFKLLTCVDLYMFTIRLSRMLRQSKTPVYKKAIDLVEKINRLSEEFIAADMNNLINQTELYSEKIKNAEYPIMQIIKKCFSDYNGDSKFKVPGIITDKYIFNNERKYNLDKYDNYPDFLKYAKYYDPADQSKVINIPEVEEYRKTVRKVVEEKKNKNLSMMSYIATRHAQKLV